MKFRLVTASIVSSLFVASAAIANASTGLSVSCVGVPSVSNIAWTATSTGGIAPISFLWGNGSTSTLQTISETPGTYTMTLQATDASSTIATTTCSATVASTTSSGPSVADQIDALLKQIAALKAQIAQLLLQQTNNNNGGSAATSTPDCFGFNRDLEQGDQGVDVEDLQKTLASDPSVFPSGLITGFFGHMTEEGVMKFQEKHGIHATGFFGPMSRSFFEDQCQSGDSDHDGVPNSIDEVSGEAEMDNGDHSATSTMSGKHEGNHQQEGAGNGSNSHDD